METEKIELNLHDYLTGFNELLLSDGFKERFVMEKSPHEQGDYDTLVLYNLNDKNKIISFIDNSCSYPGGVLYWFNTHQHFDFFDSTEDRSDIQENLMSVYETIKDILQDKLIEIRQDHEVKRGCVFDIFMNPDSLQYGKEERKYLSLPGISFMNWSGNITENMKLFAIGFFLTKMPEIIKKRKEDLESELY